MHVVSSWGTFSVAYLHEWDGIGLLQKIDGKMKVYSAYKPMILENESESVPSALEKGAAAVRQEKSKVFIIYCMRELVKMKAWMGMHICNSAVVHEW